MEGNETRNEVQSRSENEADDSQALIKELRSRNAELQNKLDNALSEVLVAECVKEDLIELDRQRGVLEDEKKTLESLLNEAQDEVTSTRTRFEHEHARIRAVNEQLENENKALRSHLKGGVSELSDASGAHLVDKETLSVITDATKNLARRMKSNLMSGGGSVSFSRLQHHDKSDDSSDTSPVNQQDPTGMHKAQDDAEAWKAIIVPLEEQVGALKDKLRETDTMLREFEKEQANVLFSAEILGRWLAGKKSFSEAMEELEKKSQEISAHMTTPAAHLESLSMSLLNARLSLVVKELNELRTQNDRCVSELERSVRRCADLRSQTAEANGRLLKCQQKHHSELAHLTSVLNEEQKVMLSTQQQRRNSSSGEASEPGMSVTSEEIVISRPEWDALQNELDKLRAVMGVGLDVDVVGSDQFKQLQMQVHELQLKCEKQGKREEKFKSEMQVMEQQWNQRAEEHHIQTTSLKSHVDQLQALLSTVETSHRAVVEDSKASLHRISSDRERIVAELKRLQVENDELLGKHHAKADELQSKVINLPEKMEDIHLLLLNNRDQLISAKIAAEQHAEKRLQVQSEMTAQVEDLKERLLLMESCKTELEAVQRRSLEIEAAAKSLRNEKTRLEKELESSAMQRARAEAQIAEMKSRIANLQQELDNSVAVQTDFVRLSQSLQMELEKIRQSEQEVICPAFVLPTLLKIIFRRSAGNKKMTSTIAPAATSNLTWLRGSTIVATAVAFSAPTA